MRGIAPTNRDLGLNLDELVLPENLLSDETLDTEEEESQPEHYRVVTDCNRCHCSLRLCVAVQSSFHIRALQTLLLDGLSLVCQRCTRELNNGRR